MHAPFKTMKVKFISCVFVWKLLEHLSKFSFNIAKDYLEGYYSAVFQISFETNSKVQGGKIYIRSRVIACRKVYGLVLIGLVLQFADIGTFTV